MELYMWQALMKRYMKSQTRRQIQIFVNHLHDSSLNNKQFHQVINPNQVINTVNMDYQSLARRSQPSRQNHAAMQKRLDRRSDTLFRKAYQLQKATENDVQIAIFLRQGENTSVYLSDDLEESWPPRDSHQFVRRAEATDGLQTFGWFKAVDDIVKDKKKRALGYSTPPTESAPSPPAQTLLDPNFGPQPGQTDPPEYSNYALQNAGQAPRKGTPRLHRRLSATPPFGGAFASYSSPAQRSIEAMTPESSAEPPRKKLFKPSK